jgi:arylsulfatase A-like enzyme
MPRPSVAVAFKSFSVDPKDPLMSTVQITDYYLQHGQGMHGGFTRANTFNFMAAIGPDFKKQFIDQSPASNADIAPTLARLLGLSPASNGELKGRILQEALAEGPSARPSKRRMVVAEPAANGRTTVLMFQQTGKQRYFDQACFTAAIGKQQRICL